LCGYIQRGGNINKVPFFGLIFNEKVANSVSPPSSTSLRYQKKAKNLLLVSYVEASM
jgi:hypothetical protein